LALIITTKRLCHFCYGICPLSDVRIPCHEKERIQWLQGKEHEQRLEQLELEAELKEQEIRQRERQKIQERMKAEK
jgi:hypothetical protein